ncbi:MAG: prolipoprotein diacylglyceryl transferase [Candidatus Woesearchaeota archaeon]
MFIHNINPILLKLGPFQIRYYGLFIVIGVLLIYFIMLYLAKKRIPNVDKEDLSDLIIYSVIGALVISRIFYCLVYNFPYYFSNPIKVFYIWEGGLSFHGGLLGGIIVGYIMSKIKKIDPLDIADMAVIPAALALVFGRLANFLNSELVGTITNLPWGVNFNNETNSLGELVYRHPSQLYESLKNLFIFIVLWNVKDRKFPKGTIFGLFVIIYSTLRFFIEFARSPDPQIGYLWLGLTLGQIINIVMFICGLIFLIYIFKKKKAQ